MSEAWLARSSPPRNSEVGSQDAAAWEGVAEALRAVGYEVGRRQGGLKRLEDFGVVTLEHALEDSGAVVRPAIVSAPADLPEVHHVGVIELAAAAGGGAADLDETVRSYVAFRRDWLSQRGLDPSQCSVIGVRGESMEPVLPAGCSILVNRAERHRRAGQVFVLRTGDGLVVKRLAQEDGRWLLLSEHPAWKPLPWDRETSIIGEVRWMARELGASPPILEGG